MCSVHVCSAVTCHLHFWQNNQDRLHATMVTNTKMESAQNADPGEEHSPVARAGTQTRDLSITSPVLHTTELPLLNTILQHT